MVGRRIGRVVGRRGLAGLVVLLACGSIQGYAAGADATTNGHEPPSGVAYVEGRGAGSLGGRPAGWDGSGRGRTVQWQAPVEPPVEARLSVGALGLLRSLRRGLRRIGNTVGAAGNQWVNWVWRAAVFVVVILLAPLADLALVRTWRYGGFRAARRAAMLGVAVNVRLLVDRRVPALARLPLVFAVVYGVAAWDLMPDGRVSLGRVDDIVVALVASRLFAALCPDARIAAHARRVAIRNAERRSRRTPVDRGLAKT